MNVEENSEKLLQQKIITEFSACVKYGSMKPFPTPNGFFNYSNFRANRMRRD